MSCYTCLVLWDMVVRRDERKQLIEIDPFIYELAKLADVAREKRQPLQELMTPYTKTPYTMTPYTNTPYTMTPYTMTP